ncbi:hypothetical protein THRCLA_02397 [Thraustotheca clavata]|uniref:CNNM transmembrane domain-containing protein n=1 Tax=Thraustotheca clavata TaxID=74557 RepID=A0A1W0A5C3_9STRA|nr:hypothetical protein THRCLA_02397 [Thraustotheca clavata]
MEGHADGSGSAEWSSEEWVLRIGSILLLVMLAAMFSGLTLGLMSLDKVGLEIVIATGEETNATKEEKITAEYARRIQPVRKDGHLLLTTLLFGNVAVNSIMAIVMADMTSGVLGFLMTTVVLVIFGELIPQALCSKHPLAIGAKALPIIRVIIILFYIFAKPIALTLDWLIGKELGTLFTKCELSKMLDIHVKQKMLDIDEINIMKGAMQYKATPVAKVMTPIKKAFTLPSSTLLNRETIETMYRSGYSRIPVWGKDINDIIGVVFVKDLIFVDPLEATPLLYFMNIFGRTVHRVWPDSTLGDVLKAFKRGRTHLALVHDVNNDGPGDPFYESKGIVSLEDIVEEILQDEIYDENDAIDQEIAKRNHALHHNSFEASARFVMEGQDPVKHISVPEANALAKHLLKNHPIFAQPDALGATLTQYRLAAFLETCPVVEYHEEDIQICTQYEVCTNSIVVLEGCLQVTSTTPQSIIGLWGVVGANCLIVPEESYVSDMTVKVASNYTRCLRLAHMEFQAHLYDIALDRKHATLAKRRHESISYLTKEAEICSALDYV